MKYFLQAAQVSMQNQQTSSVGAMPQAPSPFGMQQSQQQQPSSQSQPFINRPMSSTTPNDNGLTVSTPQTIPPPASSGPSPNTTPIPNGPQSTTSTPNTPLVPSLMTPNQVKIK